MAGTVRADMSVQLASSCTASRHGSRAHARDGIFAAPHKRARSFGKAGNVELIATDAVLSCRKQRQPPAERPVLRSTRGEAPST